MPRLTLFLLATTLLTAACGSRSGTEHDRVIYVRNDHADLMVWIRGNVDSKTLLVVTHGGPGGESTVYTEAMHAIEQDYGVVYWDQRSSGASRGLFRDKWYSYPQFGDDLRAVIETVGFLYEPQDIFLMGHSFGVEVGTEFLITGDNQDLVSGWIPVNGTFSVWTHAEAQRLFIIERADEIAQNPDNYDLSAADLDVLADWKAWAESTPTPDPMERDFLDTVWDRAMAIPAYPYENPNDSFDSYWVDWYTSPYSVKLELMNENLSYYPMDDAYTRWDRRAEVADITVPTALLWGRWDPIMPNLVAEDYYAAIGTDEADKAITWFEYAYHSPMFEQQSDFDVALKDFMETYRQSP